MSTPANGIGDAMGGQLGLGKILAAANGGGGDSGSQGSDPLKALKQAIKQEMSQMA